MCWLFFHLGLNILFVTTKIQMWLQLGISHCRRKFYPYLFKGVWNTNEPYELLTIQHQVEHTWYFSVDHLILKSFIWEYLTLWGRLNHHEKSIYFYNISKFLSIISIIYECTKQSFSWKSMISNSYCVHIY